MRLGPIILLEQEGAHQQHQDQKAKEAERVPDISGQLFSGESYYYVRVLQEDGEIAWGSPAWVTYGK